jgi:Domain of unknown function (DUF4158)
MTAIERTAYPRFKSQATVKELTELYTPSASELAFAQTQVKSKRGLLRLLVMLKSFQRLGYFPPSGAETSQTPRSIGLPALPRPS